jgi:hypothetical protein
MWARRFSGIDDFFVYRHKHRQSPSCSRSGSTTLRRTAIGIVMELEAFPAPPNWHPPTQEWVRNRLKPAQEMLIQ